MVPSLLPFDGLGSAIPLFFLQLHLQLDQDETVLPQRVGQMKELHVLMGADARLPMRLLLLRVPKEVVDQRREDLRADAKRRGEPISEESLRLADWTMLLTDVPAKRLRFEEALVLL